MPGLDMAVPSRKDARIKERRAIRKTDGPVQEDEDSALHSPRGARIRPVGRDCRANRMTAIATAWTRQGLANYVG